MNAITWLLNWLCSPTKPAKPREVIYGEEALACRSEALDVIHRNNQLLIKRGCSPLRTEETAKIDAEIEVNFARFDEIERRYFGERT